MSAAALRALLLAVFVASVTVGCAGVIPSVDRAAGVYDESLQAAEVWMCRAASVGSVLRAYARDEKSWRAWKELCGYAGIDIDRPLPPQQ